MQQYGTNPSATGDLGVMPPRRPRLRINIVSLVAWLVMVALVVGAWFGGQWYERRAWEPRYDELEMRNAALSEDNDNLDTANAQLSEDYRTLEAANEQLNEDYGTLEAANEQLSEDNARYLSQFTEYLGIVTEVNRRFGFLCDDRKSYVTPTDASVASTVFAITGGFSNDPNEQWADYDAMYNWVRTNIRYSYDSPLPWLPPAPDVSLLSWRSDYWRMPSETLEDETGDCEDMAILLASMIKNYTQSRYSCWVIGWSSEGSGHAAVAMPVTGGNLAILDPAGNQTIGFGGHQSISTTTYQWLAKWPSESGIHVSAIFSDEECSHFDSTSEFIAWAVAQA